VQESEFLVTTAQVAIGLAGFSGVAGVLGERRGSARPEVQGALLRNMIETSLLAAGFSLLPIALFDIGMNTQLLWRWSAAANLVAFVAQFALTLRRGTRIIRSGAPRPRVWGGLVFALAVGIVFCLGLSATGIDSAALFIIALSLQLVLSGGSFARFFAFLTS